MSSGLELRSNLYIQGRAQGQLEQPTTRWYPALSIELRLIDAWPCGRGNTLSRRQAACIPPSVLSPPAAPPTGSSAEARSVSLSLSRPCSSSSSRSPCPRDRLVLEIVLVLVESSEPPTWQCALGLPFLHEPSILLAAFSPGLPPRSPLI